MAVAGVRDQPVRILFTIQIDHQPGEFGFVRRIAERVGQRTCANVPGDVFVQQRRIDAEVYVGRHMVRCMIDDGQDTGHRSADSIVQ